MAFAERYFAETTSERATTVRAALKEDPFVGAATEVTFAGDGVVVMPEHGDAERVYVPLLPSQAEILLDDPARALVDLLDAYESEELRVTVTDDGAVIFEGWYEPGVEGDTLNALRDDTVLACHDGLALLKDKPFIGDTSLGTDGEPVTSIVSVLAVILRCLRATGLGLDVYAASPWHTPATGSGNPLTELYLDGRTIMDSRGYVLDCQTVLEDLCRSLHLQVRQSGGAWHVYERSLLMQESFTRYQYNTDGTAVGSAAYSPRIEHTEADLAAIRLATERQPRMASVASVATANEHGGLLPLVYNGAFGTDMDRRRHSQRPAGRTGYVRPTATRKSRGADRRIGNLGRGRAIGRGVIEREKFEFDDGWSYTNGALTVNEHKHPDGLFAAYIESDEGVSQSRYVVRPDTGMAVQFSFQALAAALSTEMSWRLVLTGVTSESGTGSLYLTDSTGLWDVADPLNALQVSDDQWTQITVGSAELPAGVWEVFVAFYARQADTTPGLPVYVTDVRLDIVYTDVGAPAAHVGVASSTDGRMALDFDAPFASLPQIEAPGCLMTYEPLIYYPAGAFKADGPYEVAELPTTTGSIEVLAESLYREQGERLKIHRAAYGPALGAISPADVLAIETATDVFDLYQMGDARLLPIRARIEADWLPVVDAGAPTDVVLLIEPAE